MDISKYDKAEVLRVLYDNAQPQGMGMLHFKSGNMSREEARSWLKHGTYFDYLSGRVMKVDLSGNELDTRLYNRDNGPDAAEKAIESLSTCTQTNKSKCMIRPEEEKNDNCKRNNKSN